MSEQSPTVKLEDNCAYWKQRCEELLELVTKLKWDLKNAQTQNSIYKHNVES
jgi:hypothetical protein